MLIAKKLARKNSESTEPDTMSHLARDSIDILRRLLTLDTFGISSSGWNEETEEKAQEETCGRL
jgi:hypothetical protein